MSRKNAAFDTPSSEDEAANDTSIPVTAPAADQAPLAAGDEPVLPNPHEGGCYVRLSNGDLKREDD